MRNYLILFIYMSLCISASADDKRGLFLQPEGGPFQEFFFSSYYSNIHKVLFQNLNDQPILCMVTIPSFQPEWMSGVIKNDSTYYIFSSISALQLWQYESLKMMKGGMIKIIYSPDSQDIDKLQKKKISEISNKLPQNIEDVKIEYHQAPLKKEIYDKLLNTWLTILYRTRYTRYDEVGLDGVSYHFSISDGLGKVMSGTTWSPPENSINGLSVELGTCLKEYSINGNRRSADEILRICSQIIEMCRIIDK